MTNPGFQITGGKGFQMVFSNGWTVSVQFGGGNYCDNYHDKIDSESEDGYRASGRRGSRDAEIAAWDNNGDWMPLGCDTVKGRVSPDDVAKFIRKVQMKRPVPAKGMAKV